MEAKQKERDALAKAMEEFLARGGAVQEIEPNVVADPPKKPDSKYGSRPIWAVAAMKKPAIRQAFHGGFLTPAGPAGQQRRQLGQAADLCVGAASPCQSLP